MKELIQQTKWQFVLLARNNIITISLIVTVMYAGLFWLLKGLPNMDKFLTLMIFNDPAIIGLFFAGISLIVERKQQVLSALFVTPINHHILLIARVLALSIIGWACALGMGISALGISFNLLHFSLGVFGICILSCLVGIYLVCYTTEVMSMVLLSIPVLLFFFNLPFLNYFELTHISWFNLLPSQGGISLLDHSYGVNPQTMAISWGYISLAIWIPIVYTLVFRTFMAKLVNV